MWLLEGLLMYLSIADTKQMMADIRTLSARGSAVFHDGVSQQVLDKDVIVGGVPFLGCSDHYADLWAEHAGSNRAMCATLAQLASTAIFAVWTSMIACPRLHLLTVADEKSICLSRWLFWFAQVLS